MRKTALTILLVLAASSASAEKNADLSSTMSGLAGDLASLQADIEAASHDRQAWAYSGSGITHVRLTQTQAPIYKGADKASGVLTKLPEGKTLPVVDKAGEWYAVQLDNGPDNYKAGWIQSGAVVPETFSLASLQTRAADSYQRMMDRVQGLKEKYSSNPYVRITGFSVDITVPPAVSIAFEFK